MVAVPATGRIVGREEELARLRAVLASAGTGAQAVVLVTGDAGVGKTALVDALAGDARSEGWRVLRVQGVEAESQVAFAGLLPVVRPLRAQVAALPGPQRDALAAALGEIPAVPGRHGDAFLLGAATLTTLADAAAEQPVLVVADDVSWIDRESLSALAFAGHRLGHDRAVIVTTLRSGLPVPASLSRVERIELSGLTVPAAATLLGPGFAVEVVERLAELTNGNPLALGECARALTLGQRSGAAELPAALPVPARLTEIYTRQMARLDARARSALLLAAASQDQAVAPVVAALGASGLDAESALAAAGAVLEIDDGTVRFRHPLLRAAALTSADPSDLRAAHLALARVATSADASALHRAAAAVGYDEELAEELARVAEHERARRGHAAAAALGERAARLTARPDRAVSLLADALDEAYLAGDADRVRRLAARVLEETTADPSPEGAHARARTLVCLGLLEQFDGTYRRSAELLEEAAALASGRSLLRTLTELGHVFYNSDQPERLARVAERAEREADAGDPEQVMLAAHLGALSLGWSGEVGPAADLARTAIDLLETDPELRDDPRHMAVAFFAPQSLMIAGRPLEHEPLAYIERRLAAARRAGALGALTTGLTLAAGALAWLGDHVRAYAYAGEAVDLLAMLGRRSEPGIAHEVLAWECAGRGLHDEALPLLQRAREVVAVSGVEGTPPHLGTVLAHCALCRGDLAEVVRVLEDQIERHGGVDHTLMPLAVAPVLVEAYLGLGRFRDADLLTERLAETVPTDAPPHALAKVERARGLTAPDPDEACAAFTCALEHHAGDVDLFERARTRLLLGMRLRRCGQRVAARAELHRARQEFLAMDHTLWAQRAADELAGTGERAVRGRRDALPGPIAALTSQETRVALLAAEGRTNREIATELFLSAKTVEHHVGAVLRKRGLRSRTELARLVAREEIDTA